MLASYNGIYAGVVVDNKDPLGNFRLRLQVPQLLGTVSTPWATPSASTNVVTPVGAMVYTMFTGGDLRSPVYVSPPPAAYVPPPAPLPIPFTDLSLGSDWTNIGAPYPKAGYSYDTHTGVVRLRGMVKAGNITLTPSIIGTLPASAAAGARTPLIALTMGASAASAGYARVDAVIDGTLQVITYGPSCTGAFLSLSGLSFSTLP